MGRWLVDPHRLWQWRRLGWLADEPLGMGGVGVLKPHRTGGDDLAGAAVMHVGQSEQADPRVAMLGVAPAEEALAEAQQRASRNPRGGSLCWSLLSVAAAGTRPR
jgi:hypothetical protein